MASEKKEMDSLSRSSSRSAESESSILLHANQKLQNPLAGLSRQALAERAEAYCRNNNISAEEDVRAFRIGGQLAGDPTGWDVIPGITSEEKEALRLEQEKKWHNPIMLYIINLICSLCATVQGMDETVVNGAQAFFKKQFGIGGDSTRDTWLLGLTNGAPYVACALVGCWLTHPLNKFLGRRGTIAACQCFMVVACLWQAFTNSWWHLMIARFALGLCLGPISATTPMFAAECAPPKLRGALVMQWQLWTAFGIMLGYAADIALFRVDSDTIVGLNWRLMLASAAIPALTVAILIWIIPESPRWYIGKNRHHEAYKGMCRLRFTKIQAARDVFLADATINAERDASLKGSFKELVTVRRNRNAFVASSIVMFLQQFCGINIVAYYSTEIFLWAKLSEIVALAASLGFGMINFIFALPAFWTIDSFGRRNLLLFTFPLMAIFLVWTGFSFLFPEGSTARIPMILVGLYMFGAVYSPGEGPVPFTYSAEAYPLYIRPKGMSCATATTWFFNFLLAVTWPSLQAALTATGAFSFYAGWNVVGFFLVLLFLPETKGRSLEELDAVFDVPLRDIVRYGWAQFGWFWKAVVFRRDVEKPRVPHREHHHHHHRQETHTPVNPDDRV